MPRGEARYGTMVQWHGRCRILSNQSGELACNKNDANDAEAIGEATGLTNTRLVDIKRVEQQFRIFKCL